MNTLRRYPNACVAFLLAALLAVAGFMLLPSSPGHAGDLLAGLTGSTPSSQWQRGTVPLLLQTDEQWADAPYADGTMRTHGCGPTCLSMVYVSLTGKKNLDPASMGAHSENAGYVEAGLTSWLLMSEGAQQLGLQAREVPADAGVVAAELAAGRPIICSVGPGDFTSEGHFIVLAGLNGAGELVVHDPNSAERSNRTWDADRVLAQCRNLWSYYL